MVRISRWFRVAVIASLLAPAVAISSRRLVAAEPQQQTAIQNECALPVRIVLDAKLKTEPQDSGKGEEVSGIIAVDPETGRWEKLVNDGYLVRVAPQGDALAFVKVNRDKSDSPDLAESGEIWTCDMKSRTATRLFDHGGWFCWSPDSSQIVSTKIRRTEDSGYNNETWRVNRNGTGRTKLHVPETDSVGDWSSDGKWFVTVANRNPFGRGLQLYRMQPDATNECRLTEDGHNCYPRFSPDSRQIVYYHRPRGGAGSLHVMDVDGTNDREVVRDEGLTGVEGSCFSPDGRRLLVVRSNQQVRDGNVVYGEGEGSFHLEIMGADGGNRRRLPLRRAEILWLGHPDWR